MSEVKEGPIEVKIEIEDQEIAESAPTNCQGDTDADGTPEERTIETVEAELEALREEFKKKIEAVAQAEREQYEAERERLLRTAAEAENTKKRLETDYQRQLKYANEAILEGMLPVLDSLEAAIKSVADKVEEANASPAFATFSEGVQLVHKQLLDALKTHGLILIDAVGQTFDPNQHEAVFATESAEVPEGDVIEEFRRGYLLHDRVLRASQVIVSQGPPAAEKVDSPEIESDEIESTDVEGKANIEQSGGEVDGTKT